MRLSAAAIAALACGCAAHLGHETSQVDASTSSGDGANATTDAPGTTTDAAPAMACASGRVVYLAFEGVNLAQGASDAPTNKAVWLGVANANIPKFRPNAADRTQQITDVTNFVKTKLTAIPEVTIVTTRPAAGPYVMVGFGGTASNYGVPYLYAVNRQDCGDTTTKSDVGWVFEDATSTQKAADFAVGAILFGLGAAGTNNVNDCMCGWNTGCQPSNTACTLGTAVTAAIQCNGQTNPQNEQQILHNFCQ